jgi:hypothetical protein
MKKTYWLAVGAIGTAVALWASTDPEEMPILASAVPSAVASTEHRYAQIPLAFERNVGQTDAEVLFLARGPGYGVFLTATEAVLSLPSKPGLAKASSQASAPTVVRMSLLGASAEPVVEGAGLQQGKSHYYYGSTPNQWQRDVERYDQVRYREVYPGIDMVYYGKQQQLEYDFVVAPGRNPGRINVKFSGVDGLRLDPDGNLILETASGTLTQQKPVLYQQVDGRRLPVQGGYRLLGDNRVGFEVAAYDAAKPLVIDPVLGYSSYFGGSRDDGIASLSTDDAGNIYAVGTTVSLNFPLKSAIQSSNRGGGGDVFVAKFNTDGNALVYSTFMGGSSADNGTGVVVDAGGNAYITGHTKSTNFPVANALQRTHAADGGREDVFVARLNSTGTLAFSTYLGGSGADLGAAIALPPSGDLYVAGSTESGNFPKVSSLDASLGGTRDGFLARLTRSGNSLVFSTYLGGGGTDQISAMSVDPSPQRTGAIYLTGETASTDFPVSAGTATQASLGGGSDAFVVVLNPVAAAPYIALKFGTYLGSANADAGEDVDLDPEGNVIVVGRTQATSAAPFPTVNPAQVESAGGIDGFVAKITLGTTPALTYSTYLGGSGEDRLRGVKVDDFGTAYVIGTTNSTDLIGTSSAFGLQHTNGGGFDAMTARYSDEGERFWASYLGGSGSEHGVAIARYGSSSIFMGGSTSSTNFSTLLPFKSTNSGASDAFIIRYGVRSMRTNARNFNADRTDDILWRNSSSGANAVWQSASGTAARLTTVPVGPWKLVGTGDFDGDARADILWRNSSTGANAVWKGGSSSNVMVLQTVTDQKWQVAGIGDFNLDSRSDILWRHGSTGSNVVWLSGDYATQQSVRFRTDTAWKVAGLGDFDGDFVSDILWRHSGTGVNDIWLSGNFRTTLPVTNLTNLSWQVAGIGDFLGDGKSDILWFQPSTGQAVIWRNADYGRRTSLPNVNLQFAVGAIGDYNGDGRSDILLRNQTTGTNVLWRSGSASNSQALASVANQAWKIVR